MSIDQFLFISISLIPIFWKTETGNETFPFILSWDSPWERILEISSEKIRKNDENRHYQMQPDF